MSVCEGNDEGGREMPQIIVVADAEQDQAQGGAVMFRERISASDLESDHFAGRLLERLEWAVGDAQEVELSGHTN